MDIFSGWRLKNSQRRTQNTRTIHITNSICFHSQQCIEKYLKAFLTFYGIPFRKTHDLTELINQCTEVDTEFNKLFEINADKLTAYSIDIRYPDDFYTPSLEEAKETIEIAEKVKSFVIQKLKKEGDC